MRIKWCGTATLVIESGKTKLLMDPYIIRGRKDNMAAIGADEWDAILITHPHLDHFCDTDAFKSKRGVFVCPKGMETARKNGMDVSRMHVVLPGDEFTVGAFTVRAYPAKHCRFDAATIARVIFSTRSWLHLPRLIRLLHKARKFPAKDGDMLAFGITDGARNALVFGSAGMDDDAAYPESPDLLVFPYQGRSRMDLELIPFLSRLSPAAVMADHFDDAFPPVSHRVDTSRFIPTVAAHAPHARAIIPNLGEWYEV